VRAFYELLDDDDFIRVTHEPRCVYCGRLTHWNVTSNPDAELCKCNRPPIGSETACPKDSLMVVKELPIRCEDCEYGGMATMDLCILGLWPAPGNRPCVPEDYLVVRDEAVQCLSVLTP